MVEYIIIAVVSSLITLIILYYWRKFFGRPKLIIDMKTGSFYCSGKGAYSMFWKTLLDLDVYIKNQSFSTAFYPEIFIPDESKYFSHLDKLDKTVPISPNPNGRALLRAKTEHEFKTKNRPTSQDVKNLIKTMTILLKYRNQYDTSFYTKYSHKDKRNDFHFTRALRRKQRTLQVL